MALSFSDAKKIPIPDYLGALGIEPAKVRGSNYWYHSPFRGERDPSFKVNCRLNLWYDHGSGEGGTLIDLGAKLNQCSISEFVGSLATNHSTLQPFPFHRKSSDCEENKLIILSATDLKDQSLINYIRSRGIDEDIACRYCKEVNFEIAGKKYSAIGFQNIAGGYELRNHWFKGSSSPKDISFIDNDSEKLSVVEGFMDFLSIQQLKGSWPPHGRETDFLILNSLSFLNRQMPTLKAHTNFLFLDNDQAGKKAISRLDDERIPYVDCSGFYCKYKDVNEYLIGLKASGEEPTIRKGLRV